MDISFSPYQLGKTDGALLRVAFSDDRVGYADCHPWMELGDLSLAEQLKLLRQNKKTPLTERSLFFARVDAEARADKVNLLENKSIPLSHYLVMCLDESVDLGNALEEGFQTFKFKVGRDKSNEIACLKKLLPNIPKARLDFNFRLTQEEYLDFLARLEGFHGKLEFSEDPFPYDHGLWEKVQRETGVSLALDRYSLKNCSAHYRVLKPAIENADNMGGQKLVVTSYAAHPLEQVCAAYVASQFKTEICGLQSHYIYGPNRFSEALSRKGPVFHPPYGTGFGFDDLLEECDWRPL